MGAPREPAYGEQRRQWLEKFGITADPFFLCEAGAEAALGPEMISYFFIDRPYLDVIFGDPAAPQSALLFAERGAGKTATCRMFARRCASGGPGRLALPVPYDTFTSLLDGVNAGTEFPPVRDHVYAMIRELSRALLPLPPAYWATIAPEDRPFLMACIQDFGYPLARPKLAAMVGSPALEMRWNTMTPREILQELARILTQPAPAAPDLPEPVAFRSLYILVDRVDESPAGPAAALPLLLPLIRDQALLTTPNVAFKFFLPAALESQLLNEAELRRDHYPCERITWDAKALIRMIDRRLEYYSNYNLRSFGELCHASAQPSAMVDLVAASGGSPRTLIRLCSELVAQVSARGAARIHPEDIDRAIDTFRRHH